MVGPWVAPDTPAAPPPPPIAAPAERPGRPAPAAGATEVPVPVPLRPFTVPDVLDGALRAWKLAPGTMAALAATFVVPTQALLGVLSRDRVEDLRIGQTFTDALTATGPDDVETGFSGGGFLLGVTLQGLALALVTAGVAHLLTGWYVGRRSSYGDVVGVAIRRAVPLAVAWVLVHLAEATAGLLLVVPLVFPLAWFAVVSPVIACERAGPLRAMRRSYRLSRRRFGNVLGICLLVATTDAVLAAALTALGALYLETGLPAGWVVNTAVTAGAMLVTVPFVAAAATLVYLDLRVRVEGLDIELAADRRFR
jgi:hypothetical protein